MSKLSLTKSRNRIAGRRYSPTEYGPALDRFILDRLRVGLGINEIADAAGKDRTTIYRWIHDPSDGMAARKLVQLAESGHILTSTAQQQAADYRSIQFDDFVQAYPSVKRWADDLMVRKNGQPLANWRTLVNSLQTLCDTLKASPEAFLGSREIAEQFYKNFVLEFRKTHTTNPHSYKMALRNFCMYNGVTWPRGVTGLMSGQKQSFGKYAHIKLSEAQITQGIKLADSWGDIDLRDWFAIGKEFCARHLALRDLDVSTLESHDGYLTMRAYESKTDKTWTKYALDPTVQRIILERVERQKAAGATRLFQNHVSPSDFSTSINQRLKKLYQAIGATDPYFTQHPTHALRHVGAHHWLRLSKYNHALVAKIGGWDDVSTLIKCYGEIPPEAIVDALREAKKKGFLA